MKQYSRISGLTLLELIISISIFAVIALGFASIDTFSRYQAITSDRRAKLQNEASYVLEHMAKNITGTGTRGGAIGDINQTPVNLTTIAGDNAIIIQIDYSNNGRWDGIPTDKQVAYRYRPAPNYEIWYYSNYTDSPAAYEVIASKNIRPDFGSDISQPTYRTYNSGNNYIDVQITACWDPAGTCGTSDNPQVTMKSSIYMPAASTN